LKDFVRDVPLTKGAVKARKDESILCEKCTFCTAVKQFAEDLLEAGRDILITDTAGAG
jgi:hypothetical protein